MRVKRMVFQSEKGRSPSRLSPCASGETLHERHVAPQKALDA